MDRPTTADDTPLGVLTEAIDALARVDVASLSGPELEGLLSG